MHTLSDTTIRQIRELRRGRGMTQQGLATAQPAGSRQGRCLLLWSLGRRLRHALRFPDSHPSQELRRHDTGQAREQIIALQRELGEAWEAAVEAENELEDQGKLDVSPLTSVPLKAASDAANACRLAIESAMFRAG
jgi:hypothetical protein